VRLVRDRISILLVSDATANQSEGRKWDLSRFGLERSKSLRHRPMKANPGADFTNSNLQKTDSVSANLQYQQAATSSTSVMPN
jgi:hypothetical protein